MKKIIKLPIIIAILTVLVALISVGSITLAKYYADKNLNTHTITADEFYFTIDLLGDTNDLNSTSKEFELYGDSEKHIDFSVLNHFDSLRITETDFEYKIETSIENDIDYVVSVTSLSDNDKKFSSGLKESEAYSIIFPQGFNNNTIVTLKVSTTDPYEKVMTLKFILNKHDSAVLYKVTDSSNSPYASLFIYCNEDISKKGILIDWSNINSTSNVFQIDMTNNYIIDGNEFITNVADENIGYLTKAYNTLSIKEGEVIEILFFKTNSSLNYSIEESSSIYEDGVYKIILTYSIN